MKKTVLTFGLISGAISALLMLATVPFMHRIGFDKGLIIGYTSMVLSFMLVFFGIRSYRENIGGGEISFARAFSVGILITIISCVCYVVTWEIVYFNFMPDFVETYSNHIIDQAKASGLSAQAIEAKRQEMKHFSELFANPFFNAAMTFIEPFPVGFLITLISAAILRRKSKTISTEQQLAG
jgi:Protein of unknown function (DUF4199)